LGGESGGGQSNGGKDRVPMINLEIKQFYSKERKLGGEKNRITGGTQSPKSNIRKLAKGKYWIGKVTAKPGSKAVDQGQPEMVDPG